MKLNTIVFKRETILLYRKSQDSIFNTSVIFVVFSTSDTLHMQIIQLHN